MPTLRDVVDRVEARRTVERAGQVVLRPLPSRRPQLLVKCGYCEPARGYALTLFCGCGLDPATMDVVEVFVHAGHQQDRDQPSHRDALMERTLDDAGRLISFLLRCGFSPAGLRDKLASIATPGDDTAHVVMPEGERFTVASPLGAIVQACVWAQDEIRKTNVIHQEHERGRRSDYP